MVFTSDPPPLIVWFRRDLRVSDHPALTAAAKSGAPVVPLFILDEPSDDAWRLGGASRWWLAGSLSALGADLCAMGSRLILRRGAVADVLARVVEETGARGVYMSRCYHPGSATEEQAVADFLTGRRLEARRFGGGLLFEPEAIATKEGKPFRVFTPFYKACLANGDVGNPNPAPVSLAAPQSWPASDNLDDWQLRPTKPDWAGGLRDHWKPGSEAAAARLKNFHEDGLGVYPRDRDRPDLDGTSCLSPFLHFGEISPRQIWHRTRLWAEAHPEVKSGRDGYLRQLVWRDFSYHLLHNWPHITHAPYNPAFEKFPWREDAEALQGWQKGRTGYPIVDAGMRQLWHTGWMHNRVRMVVASFLTKHLLIHWREGANWFWDTLVDADLANNSAGWQWVAGSGADAAPYFRVFNPVLQGKKFDPAGDYVRRWVPELADVPNDAVHSPWSKGLTPANYPAPIIDHQLARQRALDAYGSLKETQP